MLAGDIEALRPLVSTPRVRELEGADAAETLERVRALYPPTTTVTGVTVRGDAATLTVTAASSEGTMRGTVELRRERGRWKVDHESWAVHVDLTTRSAPPPPPDATRPYEYHRIVGTWRGREVGGAAGDWEVSLGAGYEVSATGPGGHVYRGMATVDDTLGLERESMRVLPGGAPFDLRITESSVGGHAGKMSLGSYKLMGDTLQLCGSEPGLMKRTSEFASTGGIRCLELRRASGPVAADTPAAPAPAPPSPAASSDRPPAGAPRGSRQDPGVSGEAVVVKDGASERYPLVTGFFSGTRFAQPRRATIQFQAPAPELSNARRIELTLDATRTGAHHVDGKMLIDNILSSDKIRIGEPAASGPIAAFAWVADGGQHFFPKTSCTITVTSAYTGSPASVFAGEVRDCTVHSAGIDQQIASARFTMRGAPSR